MKFHSLAEFLAMGGHGPFVWAVYLIALVILTTLAVAPLRRNRRFWREQTMRMKREQAAGHQADSPSTEIK